MEKASEAAQFATARAIADRWACHVDTVYTRLHRAGIPAYRFTPRLVRWRWSDVLAFEDSLVEGADLFKPDAVFSAPKRRGPQRARVRADG